MKIISRPSSQIIFRFKATITIMPQRASDGLYIIKE
jgi:hypothetical protein